jgi:hypothetical protein
MLIGAPSNVKTPTYISEAAKQLAEALDLEVRVLGRVSRQQALIVDINIYLKGSINNTFVFTNASDLLD